MSLHLGPVAKRKSLLEIVEAQEQGYSSVDFVKAFIESASKHEGPLNGDALLLQMMTATNVLPELERQAVSAYLASLPVGTLKKLERPGFGSEFEGALAEGFAESVGKEIIKPLIIGGLVAAGVCTAPVSVPTALAIGSATVVASYVSNPAVKFVVSTGIIVGEKCSKLSEKEGARKLKSGLHSGLTRAGKAVSSTYDNVSQIVSRRKRPAPAAPMANAGADKSLLALESKIEDEILEQPVLLLSRSTAKKSRPLIQEIAPAVSEDKKPMALSLSSKN